MRAGCPNHYGSDSPRPPADQHSLNCYPAPPTHANTLHLFVSLTSIWRLPRKCPASTHTHTHTRNTGARQKLITTQIPSKAPRNKQYILINGAQNVLCDVEKSCAVPCGAMENVINGIRMNFVRFVGLMRSEAGRGYLISAVSPVIGFVRSLLVSCRREPTPKKIYMKIHYFADSNRHRSALSGCGWWKSHLLRSCSGASFAFNGTRSRNETYEMKEY